MIIISKKKIRDFFGGLGETDIYNIIKCGFLISLFFSFLVPQSPIEFRTNFGPVHFTVIQNGDSNHRYVWLHGDEKTAEMALLAHIKEYKGTAFMIDNQDRVVRVDGLRLDPNRIFSVAGTHKTLVKYHPEVTKKKRRKIEDMFNNGRNKFLKELLPSDNGLLIALHNNSRGYSIDSEINDTSEYSIKPDQSRRDFFLCTDRTDYEILALSPFNVVLQDIDNEKDDGSLSILMGKIRKRYINIEVRLGWLSQQKKMLIFVEQNLK